MFFTDTFFLTRSRRWLLAISWLLAGLGSSAVLAQSTLPAEINPEATNPDYAARKERLTRLGSSSPIASPLTLQRSIQPPGKPLPDCFEPLDKAKYTPLPRNDDGSFGPVSLGFSFYLFGTPYSRVYINTNGNITFNSPLSTFSAAGFPSSIPMIAPFWADADTRAPNTGDRGKIWYRLYNNRLVVTWDSVGFYNANITKKNTFQVTIYANTGGTLSHDVVFAYGDMQWTTGNGSGGVNGLGGTPANAGVNEGGTGRRFTQIGRFNQDGAAHPNNTANSGIDYLDYQCLGFRVFDAGNQPPSVAGLPASGAITVNQGQTITLNPQFTGPEPNQVVTVTTNTGGVCNMTAIVGAGSNPVVAVSVTGAACNIGTHTITFSAADNGSPVASSTYQLTVVVNPAVSGAIWDGDLNTDYLTAQNWVGDQQPQPADSILIPASAPRFPILSANATAGDFTIKPGASMTVDQDGTLTLNGHLRTGGALEGEGLLILAASSRQAIGGAALLRIGELRVGTAGAIQRGPLAIRRVLDLSGSLTTAGFSCTLLSGATATAMVINRGSAGVIGDATVQRYISPALNPDAGYRHLAAPVAGVNFNSFLSSGFTPIINTQYNTVGNLAQPFPNIYGYDQARVTTSGNPGSTDFDRGFYCPTSATTLLADAKGYTINMPPTGLLAFTGVLHNGTYNAGLLPRGSEAASGWHLLGNPYPAPLDWTAAFAGASGLDNAVYVFKSSGQYAGSYESFVNGIGTVRYIGVGQGFFVRTSSAGSSGQLNLTNAARVTSYQNPALHREAPGSGDQRPQLRLELLTSAQQQEATYVYFEAGATPVFDRAYDALKLAGGNPLYLATSTGTTAFSINGLPALTAAGAAVPLTVYVPQAGNYTLRLGELKNLSTATPVMLEDQHTGRWHNLRQQPALAFQVSGPAAAASRFVLHIGQAQALANATAKLHPADGSIWPNPATNQLNVRLTTLAADGETWQLQLLNALGQVVIRQQVSGRKGSTNAALDVSHLPAGLYTLRGITGTQTFTRSVVLE